MRQWLAAALALVVAACAAPSRPTLGAAPDMDAPLDARLFPPYYGSVPVQLSKPAYVALFEIIPGRGAALLYPQGGTGFQQVTESWVPIRYSASRWLYANDLPGRFGYQATSFASGYDGYRGYDPYGMAQPRYLFLVASEEPLAIEQFQDDPASIRRYLGTAQYAAYEPYDVMERLAYALLPFAPAESWVMDVFVDWGYDWGFGHGPGMSAAQASYWPVFCDRGGQQFVSWVRYVSGWGFTQAPCSNASVLAPGTPGLPLPPSDSVVVPPAGEGRDRTATPDSGGRRRAGASATMEFPVDVDGARLRQRITQLRSDARADDFRDGLTERLRRDVRTRQRAAAVRGHTQPAHLAESAAPRVAPGDAAGRERAGGAPNALRDATLRNGAARTRGSRGSGEPAWAEPSAAADARRSQAAQVEATRRREASEQPASSSSTGSGSSSSGSSSSGSSGGRTRATPPPG